MGFSLCADARELKPTLHAKVFLHGRRKNSADVTQNIKFSTNFISLIYYIRSYTRWSIF